MQRRRIQRVTTLGLATAAMASFVAACGSSGGSGSSTSSSSGSSSSSSAALSGTLNASGSTFQLTFQQAAIQAFKSIQSGLTVNYGGGGSGKGRTDLASGTVNFAGSDSPIPSDETSNFKGKKVLYFPVIVGPITVSYNLSGVTKPLKMTPTVIADIFQGKITKWNDPAIASLNSGVKLPSTAITIARRSDSSGTTANFSLFLMDSTKAWKLGSSSTINWPSSSRGGDGNGGVAQIVKNTPGAIGYVDYADAKASGLSFADVQNKSGAYVAPSTAAASAAAAGAKVASDLTFAAVWSGDATAYPITYQSWDLVYAKQPNAADAKLLKAYLGYLLGAGQKLLPALSYAPLPSNLDTMAKAQLSQITP